MKKILLFTGTILTSGTLIAPPVIMYYIDATKKPEPVMDIDAYKNYNVCKKADFKWTSGGHPSYSNLFVQKYLGTSENINLEMSKLELSYGGFYGFSGEEKSQSTDWGGVKNICFTWDSESESDGFGNPNNLGLDLLNVRNYYIKINNNQYDIWFKSRDCFYNWAEKADNMFKYTEKVSIYLEINSEFGKISDPTSTWFQEFKNTEKISELVIRDTAEVKLTDKNVWNEKFKLDDINKIFLV